MVCFTNAFGELGFKNIPSGEGYIREFAAYILDKNHFSNVPVTTIVEFLHPKLNYVDRNREPKLGSIQEFVNNCKKAEDIGWNFVSKFPTREVHKIAVLDLRILNSDRHGGNIFYDFNFQSNYMPFSHEAHGIECSGIKLIPFDHGSAFPYKLELSVYDWEWYDWPQSSIEFDSETKDYILNLSFEEEMERLKKYVTFPQKCIYLLHLVHIVLQAGVKANLRLKQIAAIIARVEDDNPSVMELLIKKIQNDSPKRSIDTTEDTNWSDIESENESDEVEVDYNPVSITLFSKELDIVIESILKAQNTTPVIQKMIPIKSPIDDEIGFDFGSPSSNVSSPSFSCHIKSSPSLARSKFYTPGATKLTVEMTPSSLSLPPISIPIYPKSSILSSHVKIESIPSISVNPSPLSSPTFHFEPSSTIMFTPLSHASVPPANLDPVSLSTWQRSIPNNIAPPPLTAMNLTVPFTQPQLQRSLSDQENSFNPQPQVKNGFIFSSIKPASKYIPPHLRNNANTSA